MMYWRWRWHLSSCSPFGVHDRYLPAVVRRRRGINNLGKLNKVFIVKISAHGVTEEESLLTDEGTDHMRK